MIDFSKTLIRCSSLGVLFTEPQSAADKKAGALSKTAQAHLIKIYIKEVWGRRKEVYTKHMEKGVLAEPELIRLLSEYDGKQYTKNEEYKFNNWICGTADIVEPEEIQEGKASWEPETFLPQLITPLDKTYFYQIQGYCWLWDKKRGQLRYGLVNTPDSIIKDEQRYLLNSMHVATDLNPEYLKAEAELLKNHIFDDIPTEEKVISFEVERDEEVIAQIPGKVIQARNFLQQFHELHLKRKKIQLC